MLLIATAFLLVQAAPPAAVTIDRDNIEITQSCRVTIGAMPIIDADNNGVIHITGNDIVVEFAADSPALHGANSDQLPDSFAGTGIVVTGTNVTISGAKVSGFKVGIHAKNADGLTIHNGDVSGNFAQHLKSTPQAEDGGDWLWPHNNDNNEWITTYGAGLCVEDSKDVTLHDIRARRTQNGIVMDAVNDSRIYDCDCSFLSGWGLALWRSNRNVISRNAFDFCVRGYSHGVYNRGQDSAGILMFEQCCENVIAENSCTHGGDGFFGFAGKEALGEVNPREDLQWYRARGNRGNTFIGNDFSFAAAHGLELTFSFGNRISRNRFKGNAICGIWGGYSQGTVIDENEFGDNGEMAYGLERGGINIEHGQGNLITRNEFSRNKCGVHLWWDDDAGLLQRPWARANGAECRDNQIIANSFEGDVIAVELRQASHGTFAENRVSNAGEDLKADAESRATLATAATPDQAMLPPLPAYEPLGTSTPVGARVSLAGRQNIIMTEWGPWDHQSPLLQFVQRRDGADEYRLLGPVAARPANDSIRASGDVNLEFDGQNIRVRPKSMDTLIAYELACESGEASPPLTARGLLSGGTWTVKTFASPVDPREDVEAWRAGAAGANVHILVCDPLDLPFGSGGMTEARHLPVVLPRDHFGVIATRTLRFPKGRWRINTTSDDGIRVWLDDRVVIDDWTWHAPKKQGHDFEVTDDAGEFNVRVEYFELDGFAALAVDFAPLP